MQNPEKIEIEGLKTIHKLCKFGADHNMEGCSFTEIVEHMFDELAKAKAVPEGFVLIKDDTKTVVAIERMVEQQVEASGMDSRRLERLDGWKIIEAQEQKG